MPVVWIPSLLREMTGGAAAVTVPGETVGRVIDHLDERYPGIKGRLCQGDRLRPNIVVVVDGELHRSGLQHRLTDTSEICFLPALSGGIAISKRNRQAARQTRRGRKDLTMATMTDTTTSLERALLEGVPKIGYHIHLCPFPGALFACMQYLGDPCDYDYLMAVTGAAFRRFWHPDDGGNVDLMYLAPEPHRRAFRALGYDYATVPRADKGAMVAAIRASIARGRPAIAFGIIGPPEAGIVAGYDRGGAVLYGYSYFQDSALPGYYEKAGWFETMDPGAAYGLIVIGDKRPSRPPEREILAETLEWAIELARCQRRPERPNHVSGQAAYAAWATGLETDADYPRDDPQTLGTRVMVHGDQTVMLSERRSAAIYLRSMAAIAPEAASALQAAAAHYDTVAAYEPRIWPWGASMGPEVGRDLADPARRHAIAAAVRAAGAEEARAVQLLEQALEAMRQI